MPRMICIILLAASSTLIHSYGLAANPYSDAANWNSEAVHATLEAVTIDEKRQLLFFYLLVNQTDADYKVEDGSNVVVMMRLHGRQKSLLQLSHDDIRPTYPISIPPKRSQVLMVRYLRHTYNFQETLPLHPTPQQEREFHQKLKAVIHHESPELAGFVLLDKAKHFKIDLPWN